MIASGFGAMRAEAGCLRTARYLVEIDRLSADAPHRVGPHARRTRFVERVLSATVPADASLGDWLMAWAVARMTASAGIGAIAVNGAETAAGPCCAALLQLLDALAVAVAADGGGAAELDVRVAAASAGTWVHVECVGTDGAPLRAPEALELAALAGLPAAWRAEGGRARFVVVLDAPGRDGGAAG